MYSKILYFINESHVFNTSLLELSCKIIGAKCLLGYKDSSAYRNIISSSSHDHVTGKSRSLLSDIGRTPDNNVQLFDGIIIVIHRRRASSSHIGNVNTIQGVSGHVMVWVSSGWPCILLESFCSSYIPISWIDSRGQFF